MENMLEKEPVKLKGVFKWRVFEADGSPALNEQGAPIEGEFRNGNNTTGLTSLLNSWLNNNAPPTTWYLGLVDNMSFSMFSTSDTMGNHASSGNWLENISYSNGVRPTWTPSSASGASITNPTPASFSINASVTIKGAFLTSSATLGGTSGLLWATGAFSTPQSLINGQTLQVTYTATAS